MSHDDPTPTGERRTTPAQRQQREAAFTVLFVLAVNALLWVSTNSWTVRGVAALITVVGTPVYLYLNRNRAASA